jgi:uncharacterized protein
MNIWIDLSNSPHIPFFRPLIKEFEHRGHRVEITARVYAQTVELAEAAGLSPTVIGGHGGKSLIKKSTNLFDRAFSLMKWARNRRFDLAVSHNSHEHMLAGRALGIKSITLMDYEHHPANHFSFRLASRVLVPSSFPDAALRRCGAGSKKVRRYNGTKEDVYLADFVPDPKFEDQLKLLGIYPEHLLVVVRAPAYQALYHRFNNELFGLLLERLSARTDIRTVVLARTKAQKAEIASKYPSSNIILPEVALDGANLIAAADLIVSAGGTMNREAAALGVPTVTIFAGQWAAIDEALVKEGRLKRITTREEIERLPFEKKQKAIARRATHVRKEVADLILGD